MAGGPGNSENLRPIRDPALARELGQRGGKKSGLKKKMRKSLRERLQILLDLQKDGLELADAMSMALIEKALAGDVRAYEVIRDTIGEKPVDRIQTDGDATLRIVWGKDDTVAI